MAGVGVPGVVVGCSKFGDSFTFTSCDILESNLHKEKSRKIIKNHLNDPEQGNR